MRPAWLSQEIIDRYIKEGYWGEEDWVDRNAMEYPDKEALVDSKSRLTFSQVKQKADRLALGFLELGLKKDQIMLAQLPNIVEHFIVNAAMKKAGLISASPRMDLRHKEIEFILGRTETVAVVIAAQSRGFNFFNMIQEIRPNLPHLKYVFVVGDQVPEGAISINEMMERPLEQKYSPDYLEKTKIKVGEVSRLLATSGTTGLPKLSEMVAGTLQAKSVTGVERWKVIGDDIFAALSPLSGGASLPIGMVAPCKACKVVLLDLPGSFDAEEALKLIEREEVTFACGVPALIVMMVRHPNFMKYDLSSLRVFYYAGAKLPYSVAEEVEEKMGCRVLTLLGAVDMGTLSFTSYDDPPEVRRTSVGKPYHGVNLKLIDDRGQEVTQGEIGEITMTGPAIAHYYYKDHEASLALRGGDSEGWCHTGDLGKLDEQGNLYIVGRKKDMIIRGGQNIYPAEIEGMLITHPKTLNVVSDGEKNC